MRLRALLDSTPRLLRLPSNPRRALLAAGVLCLLLLAGAAACFAVLDQLYPFPVRAFSPPAAAEVQDRNGELLRAFLPLDGRWRFPVRLEQVAPEMRRVLVASEDRFFRLHPGVNPLSILRAAWVNLVSGRVVSGGSTIQMQLARLAEPRARTFTAKLVEAFRALQLGLLYSKDELLEIYLNMAPFGGNIVGIGAAARFYCGKSPSRLSLGEAALLTVLPRAPRGYDPVDHPQAARGARDRLLDVLCQRGVISAAEARAAKAQELPRRMRRLPMHAPHLARELWQEYGLPGSPQTVTIRSTLDLRVQRRALSLMQGRMPRLREQGLDNAAVVVLDHETREIRALVGSDAFFDEERHGQIDATRIRRSPGSTLKPFLYALAMERGLVVPETFLLDVPTDFAGYVARNYDDQYRGRVTVREALTQSLNAPAVRLLARVGVAPFLDLLRRTGLGTLDKPAGHYGLPLVLGAGEVRLLDLTNAYATLAQGGVMLPVREVLEVRQGATQLLAPPTVENEGVRLLSPEACHLLGGMLSQVERSDLPQAWNLARDVPAVAWKTGTSYGHRDAWAVGYSGTYAIGVWVGNLDGRPELGISGSRHAGPLLFELFRALEPPGSRLPEPDGLHLDEVEVCAGSRELATPLCPRRERIEVIAGVTQLPRDSMHRRIFVDAETGERLEGSCLTRRPHRAEVVRVDPPELLAWRRSRGMAPRQGGLPPLSALCTDVPAGPGPSIVSPSPRTPYLLRPGTPREFQRIALKAHAGPDARRLYWYQDGQLVASGTPEENLFVSPEPGEHRLVLLDALGRQDSVTYRVEPALDREG